MGIIYNEKVEEKKLYAAYGLTVYGKINMYDWTIFPDREPEECLITLRISHGETDIFQMYLGNNCIMYDNFDRTIDNFLYWIQKENPDVIDIEKQVYDSLCSSDCLFNRRIENLKFRHRKEEEKRKRHEEMLKKRREELEDLKEQAKEEGYIFYYDGGKAYKLNALTEQAREIIQNTIAAGNSRDMEKYIQFAIDYPDNKDFHIVKTLEV